MYVQILDVKKKITIYIDEVGRWPLAGPVYVWLVMTTENASLLGYRDSKKCTPKLREILYQKISTDKNIQRATAKCSHSFIDTKWISTAIHIAIIMGLEKLLLKHTKKGSVGIKDMIKHIGPKNIQLVLDGNHDFKIRNTLWIAVETIIKGDDKIPQIAMASIVAKVERDAEMVKYHKKYPAYLFDQHKWYGTLCHRQAIIKHGPCKIHRKTFLTRII